jgi:hypothetical protein
MAEQGILFHHAGQAIGRGRHGALVVVEESGGVLVRSQNLLHIAQLLLGLGRELAIGILQQQLAALVLGADGVHGVAIRLVHLLVMDIANPFLGLRGFLHVRIEQLEVLVFGFGLRQTMRAAFAEPTVGNGQLGFGQILAAVVGVDERLQGQPRDLIAAMLYIVDGPVEKHLIGLFGDLGDGVRVFVAAYAAGTQEGRQRGYRDQVMKNAWIHHGGLADLSFCASV